MGGGGGGTAAMLTLDIAIGDGKKEAAKGVAGFPNRLSSRNGHPLFSLLSSCLLFRFV